MKTIFLIKCVVCGCIYGCYQDKHTYCRDCESGHAAIGSPCPITHEYSHGYCPKHAKELMDRIRERRQK